MIDPTGDPETLSPSLADAFRGYRAEWLGEDVYALFTEPSFFPELKAPRPCVLTGGRGTGKTTLLRCLSYEGQYALAGRQPERLREATFFGLYYKVNTNRVRALRGPELDEDAWIRCFAHYINLELSESLLRFLAWYSALVPGSVGPQPEALGRIALSLAGKQLSPRTVDDLIRDITTTRLQFEADVNNVGERGIPRSLSMQGAPIDQIAAELSRLPEFLGKRFYFLIDEYENLEDYQQSVLNTLIKHAPETYTFKIGVKELGFRCKDTLNRSERLTSPSDYVLIDIRDSLGARFTEFALRVCDQRLQRSARSANAPSLKDMLPTFSLEEEAILLGAGPLAEEVRLTLLAKAASDDERRELSELSAYELFFISYCSRLDNKSFEAVWNLRRTRASAWRDRLNNYGYASLSVIRQGKRGYRRYYSGWPVLTQMAGGNLRYFMELVATCLQLHLNAGSALSEPIAPQTQTAAAQAVGRKNLKELEGQSIHGANLTRLLLGLGRVFQVMAWEPEGHTPEVTQFELEATLPSQDAAPGDLPLEVSDLINGAVTHLALLRFPGSKLQAPEDTRDYDYAIHPIYSALFEYSYRRKRKMTLTAMDLIGLVRRPTETIGSILARHRRSISNELPEQLGLFREFYASGS